MLLSEIIRYIADNVLISDEQYKKVKQRLLKEVSNSNIVNSNASDAEERDSRYGKRDK